MWNQDNPIIIDWEVAGYVNPMQQLTETAIYWAEDKKGNIDKEKFLSYISGYKVRCGKLEAKGIHVIIIKGEIYYEGNMYYRKSKT